MPAVGSSTFPWTRSLRVAACIFLSTRLLIFGIWSGIACLGTMEHDGVAETTLVLDGGRIAQELRRLARQNDANWYIYFANNGYEHRPIDLSAQANWEFFPLHPLLWRCAMQIWSDGPLVGMALANLFFLFGLVLLHRLAVRSAYDARTADRAVLFAAICPTSYFFSLPWSESLFFFLSVATFWAAFRRSWGIMFFAGAAACACRFAGVFLIPAIFAMLWADRSSLPRVAWVAATAFLLGLLSFMVLLHFDTNNALAFIDIQPMWGRHLIIPYKAFGVVLLKPYFLASDWNLRPLNFAAFAFGIGACRSLIAQRQAGFALFLGLGLLAPAFTGSLTSLARYAFGLFPYALAAGAAMRRRNTERMIALASISLLVIMTIAFQKGLTFAGA